MATTEDQGACAVAKLPILLDMRYGFFICPSCGRSRGPAEPHARDATHQDRRDLRSRRGEIRIRNADIGEAARPEDVAGTSISDCPGSHMPSGRAAMLTPSPIETAVGLDHHVSETNADAELDPGLGRRPALRSTMPF
jgi:hypothetical protein